MHQKRCFPDEKLKEEIIEPIGIYGKYSYLPPTLTRDTYAFLFKRSSFNVLVPQLLIVI